MPLTQLATQHSQLSATPFLGFQHLGPSTEQDHLRNYDAEAREADREHDRQLKNSNAAAAKTSSPME